MSNHYHAGLHDPDGNFPVFLEHFHALLARCLNTHWGRFEAFWSSAPTSVVRLLEDRGEIAVGLGSRGVGETTVGLGSGSRVAPPANPRDNRVVLLSLRVRLLFLGLVAIAVFTRGGDGNASPEVLGVEVAHARQAPSGRGGSRKRLLAELGRAKAKHPVLARVRADSVATGFATWLSAGQEIPVWVLDRRHRCVEEALARQTDEPPEKNDGEPDVRPPGQRIKLTLRHCRSLPPDRGGRERRTCVYNSEVGHEWLADEHSQRETKVKDRFVSTLDTVGFGTHGSLTYGVLQGITAQAARYGGRPVFIDPSCVRRSLPCANGGYRDCRACGPRVLERELEYMTPPAPVTITVCTACPICAEPCPDSAAEEEHLGQLNRLGLWVRHPARAVVAGIYRSLAACEEDAGQAAKLPQPWR
jgi:hypothetical protein